MNTPASAVVPSREAVEWLFDIHPIHITPQQIDELQEKSRTLLAVVERLTAREPLILELNRCVSENTAVLAASLDTNDLLIAERDTLRTTVAQLERTVADQAAALAERDKVVAQMRVTSRTFRAVGQIGAANEINQFADRLAALAASVSSTSEEGGT